MTGYRLRNLAEAKLRVRVAHGQLLAYTKKGLLPARDDGAWPEGTDTHLFAVLALETGSAPIRSLDRRLLCRFLDGARVMSDQQLKTGIRAVLRVTKRPANKLRRLTTALDHLWEAEHDGPGTPRSRPDYAELHAALDDASAETVRATAQLQAFADANLRDATYGMPDVDITTIAREERLALLTARHLALKARRDAQRLPRVHPTKGA